MNKHACGEPLYWEQMIYGSDDNNRLNNLNKLNELNNCTDENKMCPYCGRNWREDSEGDCISCGSSIWVMKSVKKDFYHPKECDTDSFFSQYIEDIDSIKPAEWNSNT